MERAEIIKELDENEILIEKWLQTMKEHATHDSFKDDAFLFMLKSAVRGFLIFTEIKGYRLTKEMKE